MKFLKRWAKCSAPDCQRHVRASGLCSQHYTAASRVNKPDAALQHSLAQYGVSIEWYRAKEKEQKGCCALCGLPEWRKRNGKVLRLAVDHNHVTGKPRALLCSRCNMIVGIVESIELVMRANVYFARFDDLSQGF